MSRPPCQTSPEVCDSRPAMIRRSVVLPQPEGPRKQTNSPLRMPRSMPCRATKAPNSLRTRRSSSRWSGANAVRSAFFRLAVVAAGPFGEDPLAVVGRPVEVHLDEPGFVVLRHVGERRRDAGLRGDREI